MDNTVKMIKCPICKEKNFEEHTVNGKTVYICKICGSCYSDGSWFHLGEKE